MCFVRLFLLAGYIHSRSGNLAYCSSWAHVEGRGGNGGMGKWKEWGEYGVGVGFYQGFRFISGVLYPLSTYTHGAYVTYLIISSQENFVVHR